MSAEERVWNRKEESTKGFRNWEKGLNVDIGYDPVKLEKICKEEGTTLEAFSAYAQQRVKEENN